MLFLTIISLVLCFMYVLFLGDVYAFPFYMWNYSLQILTKHSVEEQWLLLLFCMGFFLFAGPFLSCFNNRHRIILTASLNKFFQLYQTSKWMISIPTSQFQLVRAANPNTETVSVNSGWATKDQDVVTLNWTTLLPMCIAQWQYRSQLGLSEARLLPIETSSNVHWVLTFVFASTLVLCLFDHQTAFIF